MEGGNPSGDREQRPEWLRAPALAGEVIKVEALFPAAERISKQIAGLAEAKHPASDEVEQKVAAKALSEASDEIAAAAKDLERDILASAREEQELEALLFLFMEEM
jgi:hypothetical protein